MSTPNQITPMHPEQNFAPQVLSNELSFSLRENYPGTTLGQRSVLEATVRDFIDEAIVNMSEADRKNLAHYYTSPNEKFSVANKVLNSLFCDCFDVFLGNTNDANFILGGNRKVSDPLRELKNFSLEINKVEDRFEFAIVFEGVQQSGKHITSSYILTLDLHIPKPRDIFPRWEGGNILTLEYTERLAASRKRGKLFGGANGARTSTYARSQEG